MTQIDFQPATNCISWNARVLIRGVLAHHVFGAEVEPVVFAPRACQKGDGGFGTGLEPVIRASHSRSSWAAAPRRRRYLQ